MRITVKSTGAVENHRSTTIRADIIALLTAEESRLAAWCAALGL